MRPSVLVLTPDYPPSLGGIQRLTAGLVEHWTRCDVRVVTLGHRSAGPVHRVRAPIGSRAARIAALNGAALADGLHTRPDAVFSVHIVLSPAARALRWLTGARYVQYVHGLEIRTRPRLAAAALRAADAVVANSAFTADLARSSGADELKLHRIAPGVDGVTDARDAGRFDRPTIVTVSRLEERYKGHDTLLRAIPLIRARVPDARLVVVGEGTLRPAYEGFARALGLGEAVTFAGAVSDEERNRLVARSHVFAMPSRVSANGSGEGFGIAYLEAGALGLPVVAGNVGGAVDAVIHGKTGVLVDPTDHVAVAESVSALLLDRERANSLGRAGAKRAQEFAWAEIADRVEDVVLNLAKERA